jgi:MFS transporter, ACS family, glucarate transporter
MLTGVARSYSSLLSIRFLFGAGEAGAFPNMSRAYSRWFPAAERAWANGVLFLGSRLGGAAAPFLAVLLIQRWGWRVSFAVFGAIGFLWAAAWYRWFRDEPSEHASVSPGELAHIRGGSGQAGNEPEGQLRIPWLRIVTSRSLLMTCLMYFTFGYGLYFYFTWLPTYLIRELGFSGIQGGLFAGLPFLLAGVADLAGGWTSDRLAKSHGLRVGRSGLGFVAFSGSALLLFGSTAVQGRTGKAILIALALASADLALSAAWAVCLDIGREYAGVVTGFMNTFGNLGGFFGPLVAGYAIDRWGSWTLAFYVAAGVYAAGAICWLFVNPNDRI